MRLNIDRDLVKQLVSGQLPNKSRHLDELTHEPSIWQCDTGQWLSCFDSCQLTILWMANIKDVDLPRHSWDTSPFLLIVSPTLPVRSVDAYVRTYVPSVSHVTTKQKVVDHILWVWGSVPRALRARGSPAIIPIFNGFLPWKGNVEFSRAFFLAEIFETVSFDPYNFRITRLSAGKSERMKNFWGIKICPYLPFKY